MGLKSLPPPVSLAQRPEEERPVQLRAAHADESAAQRRGERGPRAGTQRLRGSPGPGVPRLRLHCLQPCLPKRSLCLHLLYAHHALVHICAHATSTGLRPPFCVYLRLPVCYLSPTMAVNAHECVIYACPIHGCIYTCTHTHTCTMSSLNPCSDVQCLLTPRRAGHTPTSVAYVCPVSGCLCTCMCIYVSICMPYQPSVTSLCVVSASAPTPCYGLPRCSRPSPPSPPRGCPQSRSACNQPSSTTRSPAQLPPECDVTNCPQLGVY